MKPTGANEGPVSEHLLTNTFGILSRVMSAVHFGSDTFLVLNPLSVSSRPSVAGVFQVRYGSRLTDNSKNSLF